MKKLALLLAALLPFPLFAGIMVDSTGVKLEGRFHFSEDKGLVFQSNGVEAAQIQPGNFRALEFDLNDAIWPEEFRRSAKTELGLLGSYFEDTKLEKLKHERVDGDIDFNWGGGGPFKNWRNDHFSVRWTGSLQVDRTGEYEFITSSDDGVRLSIDGKQLIENWTDHSLTENRSKVRLEQGKQHTIRVEYFENSGEAVIRVEYIDPSNARRNLRELLLSPPEGMTGEPDLPELSATGLKPGVILRDGTYLATEIKQANDTAMVLGRPFDDLTISTFNVARVVFREIPADTAARATASRQGALLVGGDFVDGEFKSYERGMLKLSSLLFGFQALETKYETHALILREPKLDESHWRVRDYRGNVFLAQKLAFDGDQVVITSPVLKEFRLPLPFVYRIDSGTARELFPAALDFGPDSVHSKTGKRRSEEEIRRQKDSARKNSAREKMYRLRDENKELERMAKEQDEAAEAAKKLGELEKKVAGLREEFTGADKEWKTAAARYDESNQQYNQAVADQRTTSRAYDLAKSAEGRANSNLKNLDRQLGSLRGQLKRHNRNRSESQTAQLKARIATTEKQYNAAKESYAAAVKKSREASTAKSEAYRRASQLRSESARAKSDRDGKQRTMYSRKKSLDYYEGQLKTAKSRLASAMAKVEARQETELR